ncbi:MAG TPA: DUF2934 domain-containing protein [bacterium]|nr:DUF2934 domain-containing protein [bacterium]
MAKTKVKKTDPGAKTAPTPEQVREAAYYRWLERGAPPGDGQEDWYEVENRWRDNIVPANND